MHQGKLKFFCFHRARGTNSIELLVVEIPEFNTSTVQDQPTTLGVPIMHQHITVEEFAPEVRMTHRLTGRYSDLSINIILACRAFQAYVLSKIDYVGTGVYLREEVLEPVAAATRRYFRKIYGLPPWSRNTYVQLPVELGGAGAPDLAVRQHIKLFQSYMQAS